jgi:hypothetical protein
MTTSLEKRVIFTLVTSIVWLVPMIAHGQALSKPSTAPKGATEVLANFEKRAKSGDGTVLQIILHPEEYPRARVDSVIDGLEKLALSVESELVRTEAAGALGMAGSAKKALPGVFNRELRVYRNSTSRTVRAMIVHHMWDQSERDRAIAFLKSIAVQDSDREDFSGAPFLASMSLSEMGADGRSALAELGEKRLLRDARTAGFVDWFLDRQSSR